VNEDLSLSFKLSDYGILKNKGEPTVFSGGLNNHRLKGLKAMAVDLNLQSKLKNIITQLMIREFLSLWTPIIFSFHFQGSARTNIISQASKNLKPSRIFPGFN
jgi:hypothetical protein